MSESRWNLLERLFAELAGAEGDARARRLTEIGAEDPLLRTELEALLAAAIAPANPLDTPPVVEFGDTGVARTAGPFTAGSRVGPYVLERLIGEGGMGWVWLAERTDGSLKRKVALKLPKWTWALPDLSQRLDLERDILASLEHANIARLYDAGMDDLGRPYLAMEYVEGQSIDAYSRDRRLTVEDRLRLVLQVAGAVSYAHSRLVVHRDLKPGNIVVAADGTVRLLDFGIAKLLENEGTTGRAATQRGTQLFTLQYAAPEQLTGGAIGTATDVYALALVTYELLAGVSPYRTPRGGAAALEEAILSGDTRLASAAVSDRTMARRLRGDLDAILNKALKSSPAERYASIDAFADDLQRHLRHETVSAQPDSGAYRARTFARRHRVGLAAAAVVAVTLAAATVYSARQAGIAQREARKATAIKDFLLETFQRASATASISGDPKNLRAMQVVDEGRARLTTALSGEPEVQLELIPVLGNIYESLDATDQASAIFAAGLPIANQALGPRNKYTPLFLTGIANALFFSGDFAAADSATTKAEAAFDLIGDRESRAYASLLKLKGAIVRRLGPEGQRQAVTLLRDAADLFANRYAAHPDHEGTFMFLAQTYMQLEQPNEALAAADATVRASEFLPAEDRMNRASAHSLRASILDHVGEAGRAELDYAEASAEYRVSVGTDHFLYLQNENLRALTLQTLGRRAEALSVLEASTSAVSRVRPRTNTEMNTLHRASVAFERDGQPARALAAVMPAVAMARADTPGTTPALLSGLLLDEARARLLLGDAASAARLAQEAIDSAHAKNALSPTTEAEASIVLGEAALMRGDRTRALELSRRAQMLSAGDAFAAKVRRARATLLESRATEDVAGAQETVQRAVALLDALPPPGDPFVRADVLDHVGELACTSGARTEGRAVLQQALALRQRHQDPKSALLATTAARLARCAS